MGCAPSHRLEKRPSISSPWWSIPAIRSSSGSNAGDSSARHRLPAGPGPSRGGALRELFAQAGPGPALDGSRGSSGTQAQRPIGPLHRDRQGGVERVGIGTVGDLFPASRVRDVSPDLDDLRRRRDPDEIEVLKRVAGVAEAGYVRAREVLSPGRSELEIYIEIVSAMIENAGEPIRVGGDFATGPRSTGSGGPPIDRRLEAGTSAPTISFPSAGIWRGPLQKPHRRPPSDLQQRGWEIVTAALELAESLLEPGRPAREAYQTIRAFLERDPLSAGTFWHHLGHGVGMGGHENPRLVPGSHHVLRLGDVISIEPGFYNPELQGRPPDREHLLAHGKRSSAAQFPSDGTLSGWVAGPPHPSWPDTGFFWRWRLPSPPPSIGRSFCVRSIGSSIRAGTWPRSC